MERDIMKNIRGGADEVDIQKVDANEYKDAADEEYKYKKGERPPPFRATPRKKLSVKLKGRGRGGGKAGGSPSVAASTASYSAAASESIADDSEMSQSEVSRSVSVAPVAPRTRIVQPASTPSRPVVLPFDDHDNDSEDDDVDIMEEPAAAPTVSPRMKAEAELQSKREQLDTLRSELQTKQERAQSAQNPVMKKRYVQSAEKLTSDIAALEREISTLESQIPTF